MPIFEKELSIDGTLVDARITYNHTQVTRATSARHPKIAERQQRSNGSLLSWR